MNMEKSEKALVTCSARFVDKMTKQNRDEQSRLSCSASPSSFMLCRRNNELSRALRPVYRKYSTQSFEIIEKEEEKA